MYRRLCPFARGQTATRVADASCCAADKRYGMMAVVVEPEEDHQREKVAQVKRRRSGIDASINADLFRLEELVKGIAVAIYV